MRRRTRWTWSAATLAIVLVGAACSDDDGDTPAATDAPSETTTDQAAPPTTATTTATTTTATVAVPGEGIVAVCPGEEFVDSPQSIVLARELPDGEPEAMAAAGLESVVAGLTADEQSAGYLVPWPDGTDVLRGVTLDGDTLTVDFDPGIIDAYVAAPGSSTRFFVPLVETAFHTPEVERLVFTIDGQASEWDEWWQGDASRFDRTSWRGRRSEPQAACPA